MLYGKSSVITMLFLSFVFSQAGDIAIQEGRLVPKLLNYQGYITDTIAIPIDDTLDMTFKIFDAVTSGNELWSEMQTNVPIERGVFSVLLGETTPIPDSVFADFQSTWLELTLEGPQTLSPRTRITSVGYAYTSTFSDTAEYAKNAAADNDWTVSGGIMYPSAMYGLSMRNNNILYGAHDTTHVCFGIACTTGTSGQDNKYCTVGGGFYNRAKHYYATVSGGYFNTASGVEAAIGGGINNTASSTAATIAGGIGNIASDMRTTVGGGEDNTASADYATISGGRNNTASGYSTTVPGGIYNTASGDYSFAAGDRAKANHDGAFVWADATGTDFASTDVNQFLIRASGGVGIGTTNPQDVLHVAGGNIIVGNTSSTYAELMSNDLAFHRDDAPSYICQMGQGSLIFTTSGGAANPRMTIDSTGNIGVGTTNPSQKLHVQGNARITGAIYDNNNEAGISGQVLSTTGSGVDWVASPLDGDWTLSSNILYPSGTYGLSMRSANVMYGSNANTHVCFGSGSITGESGMNIAYCTVGGGDDNTASGQYTTVSGGQSNTASAWVATVGGGYNNTADDYASVGGGFDNNASGDYSTVGGGQYNLASNMWATVPGGRADTASGRYSFAANDNSKALHDHSAAFNGQTTTAQSQTCVALLSKVAGSFTIDHPLDPENKILNHYFVESPDMSNIYSGSVVLNANGRAQVDLPDYFDALNRNPRVQLTGVGSADGVYIAEDFQGNRFAIGGKPGMKVYWTVTADRKDPSAEIARIIMPVEQPKDGQLAGRSLDDDFLCATMQQLERMGKAGQFQFRTAAARQRYEEMKKMVHIE